MDAHQGGRGRAAGRRTAVVIGGGYIGLEMAEALRQRGPGGDAGGAGATRSSGRPTRRWRRRSTSSSSCTAWTCGWVRRSRASTKTADGLTAALEHRRGGRLRPGDPGGGRAAGVEAGPRGRAWTIGPTGGIVVDEHMRTSDPDIFAVGDAVEVSDFVGGAPALIPLAGPANRQGRIAADNALGRASVYRGTPGHRHLQGLRPGRRHDGPEREGPAARRPAVREGLRPSRQPRRLLPRRQPDEPEAPVRPQRRQGPRRPGRRGRRRGQADRRAGRGHPGRHDGRTTWRTWSCPTPRRTARPRTRSTTPASWPPTSCAATCGSATYRGRGRTRATTSAAGRAHARRGRRPAPFPAPSTSPWTTCATAWASCPRDKEMLVFCQVGLRGYLACRILAAERLPLPQPDRRLQDLQRLGHGMMPAATGAAAEGSDATTPASSDHVPAAAGPRRQRRRGSPRQVVKDDRRPRPAVPRARSCGCKTELDAVQPTARPCRIVGAATRASRPTWPAWCHSTGQRAGRRWREQRHDHRDDHPSAQPAAKPSPRARRRLRLRRRRRPSSSSAATSTRRWPPSSSPTARPPWAAR